MSQYPLHLERAREYYGEGNYEGARAAAEYALGHAEEGEGVEAQVIMALSYRRLEMNDEALSLLKDIVNTHPTPEACAEYALLCAERGHCDVTCREFADRARNEDPDLPNSYLALFWCDGMDGAFLDAVRNLRKGILRGGEFSASHAFEMIRGWCQELCDQGQASSALNVSAEVVDLFNSFDFIILHAKLAEICESNRVAVKYYKKALLYLRPGTMRNDVLEAIARIAM